MNKNLMALIFTAFCFNLSVTAMEAVEVTAISDELNNVTLCVICRDELEDGDQKIEFPCQCYRSFCFCLTCFADMEKYPSYFRQCTICKKSPDMAWFLEQIQNLNFSSLRERSDFEARYIPCFDPKLKNYRPRPTPPSDVPEWAILHDDFPYILPNAVASGAAFGAAGLVCGGALSLGGWLTSLEAVKLGLSCAGGMCCFNMIPVIFPREIYLEDAIEEHRRECERKARKNAAKERLEKEREKKNL